MGRYQLTDAILTVIGSRAHPRRAGCIGCGLRRITSDRRITIPHTRDLGRTRGHLGIAHSKDLLGVVVPCPQRGSVLGNLKNKRCYAVLGHDGRRTRAWAWTRTRGGRRRRRRRRRRILIGQRPCHKGRFMRTGLYGNHPGHRIATEPRTKPHGTFHLIGNIILILSRHKVQDVLHRRRFFIDIKGGM